MAMAVQQGAFLERRELEFELSGGRFARQEFLEQKRILGNAPRRIALHQRRNLVAETEQATRLKADHRDIPFNVRRECSERALRFRPRLVESADREKSPAAAQWAAVAVIRLRDIDPIAGRAQHRTRRIDIFAIEITIEGVGEQNDFFAVVPGFRSRIHVLEIIRPPLR